MERALLFKEGRKETVPGVVHMDGTGRLQSVTQQTNPLFYRLIDAFRSLTGVPVLLNTSFNIMGKPIIHSAEDAFALLCTTGLDCVVIDDMIFSLPDVTRADQSEGQEAQQA
jgi:carbamoyltransferase